MEVGWHTHHFTHLLRGMETLKGPTYHTPRHGPSRTHSQNITTGTHVDYVPATAFRKSRDYHRAPAPPPTSPQTPAPAKACPSLANPCGRAPAPPTRFPAGRGGMAALPRRTRVPLAPQW